MIFKPDCECGHMAACHEDQWGECSVPGCGCATYRPKERRRWWRPRAHRPPAGHGVFPEHATAPPTPRRPPLPGQPAQADPASPAPPPGLAPKCFDFRAAGWDCGCLIVRHYPSGKQHQDLCEPHAFAAEWNERLRQ